MKYISADWIFPVSSSPIRYGVLAVADDGEIKNILTPEAAQQLSIKVDKHYAGVLVPGFVNTHCHLELSHMQGRIAQQTGLPNFIKGILANRQQPEDEIITAMENADREMFENGIVAVGDIANLLLSKSVKLKSKIYYHTFVEVFGFNRPSAPIIELASAMKNDFGPLRASIVPHAPYSVSTALFGAIREVTEKSDILSIHNQETRGENELFETGTGQFADFFAELGIAQHEAHGTNKRSIEYHLPQLPKKKPVLMVHNTMSNAADVAYASQTHQMLYWCICPNANLYIENTLPQVSILTDAGVNITLGTDSLASNHQLNILAEMKTLQDHQQISFEQSLPWATLNGASFLQIDHTYGSFEVGKKPGIVWLNLAADFKISDSTKITRLY